MTLKQYKMTIRTLGPVYIGNGQTYTNKEYLESKVENTNTYYFPDMTKVYEAVSQKGEIATQKFENFLLNHSNGKRLQDVLNDLQIKVGNLGGYHIARTGLENPNYANQNERTKPLNEIQQFMKDPYGKPYIPGSSIKGALRTILVNQYFKTDNTKNDRQAIPWGANTDDIFNQIRVSDSEPIDPSKLILVKKIDYKTNEQMAHSRNRSKRLTDLPIHRESLKPFTEITLTITAEGQKAQALVEGLPTYSQAWYKRYKAIFLQDNDYTQDNVWYPLYLGGGAGGWTKVLFDEQMRPNGQITPKFGMSTGKTKMIGKGVMKLTKAKNVKYKTGDKNKTLINNENSLYEMGKATFMLKELD